MMMVAEISRHAPGDITTLLPYAHGLHYQALWWLRENARRQLAAVWGRIPEIRLFRFGSAAAHPARATL